MDYNSDFRYDLKLGQETENELGRILKDKTIEVKDDSAKSSKTGNVFIEYESRNKPSGISTTLSDYYAIKTSDGTFILIETNKLKDIARKHYKNTINGGDNNTSKGILIPRCDLL